MNNEPVAWMLETQRGKISCFVKPSDEFDWIPLYTHPSKDLTDEEIIEIWSGMETDTGEQNIAFARAILRKAQEK